MGEIWGRVLEIRAAARFVFDEHPELARLPSSERGRQQRATSRRRARAAAETNEAEVTKSAEVKVPRARSRAPRAKKRPSTDGPGSDG